jgi:hypothetical protein
VAVRRRAAPAASRRSTRWPTSRRRSKRLDRLGESGERLSYFRRARNVLSGERIPPPNLAADSPAGRAAAWQGTSTYPGTDRWFNARLMPGDEIGAGSLSFDRKRPFSGFAVPRPVLDEVGTDARRLYEGVQVGPWEGTYRDEVTVLRATRETDVAVSYAFANTDYGAGGLGHVFVPDMQKLVDDGVLEVLERRSMENTIARLCRPVASR